MTTQDEIFQALGEINASMINIGKDALSDGRPPIGVLTIGVSFMKTESYVGTSIKNKF
jgi:hypothetical protein